jgi:hypothetical protein
MSLDPYFEGIPKDLVIDPSEIVKRMALLKKVEDKFSVVLASDYKEFVAKYDGYEGTIGEAYVHFIAVEEILQMTEAYGGEFLPWIIYIGSDGGNEMLVIDCRTNPIQFGLLPYIADQSDFVPLGATFEEFVRHVHDNDYWPK